MGVITYNGVSSDTLKVSVQEAPTYSTPEKVYEMTHVPGRNGDVPFGEGAWNNVQRTYNIAIDATRGFESYESNTFAETVAAVVAWLHSSDTYARLEDTYEPDYYRKALFKDALDIENLFMQAGQTDISFECMPQRFLKSGESAVTVTSGGTITNPTLFKALPLIDIVCAGSGTLTIGNYTVKLADIDSEIIIDCDLQDAYYGTENLNSKISLEEFPVLVSGSNKITYSGSITSVSITPRWWTL